MSILQVKNLSKNFAGVHAVDGLSLSIEKAKVTSVIGPNGSGKTTLTNLLSGVFPFDAGVVVVRDTELQKAAPYRMASLGLTRTFQEVRLFNQVAVLDNILVVLTSRGVWRSFFSRHSAEQLSRAESLLKQVGLWQKKDELAGNLSYGQRKLLEIARALAMEAEIYLFDEPFAGLFPEMINIVVSVIEGLRQQGRTVVLIEHNMDLIRRLSDQVIVLDSGKLLASGEPNEVLSNPAVIEAYLGK